jgi:hypothetical protein
MINALLTTPITLNNEPRNQDQDAWAGNLTHNTGINLGEKKAFKMSRGLHQIIPLI